MAYILIMALVVLDAIIFILIGYLLYRYRQLDNRIANIAFALIAYIVNNSDIDPDELPNGLGALLKKFNSI